METKKFNSKYEFHFITNKGFVSLKNKEHRFDTEEQLYSYTPSP